LNVQRRTYTFPPSRRIRSSAQFSQVFNQRVRESRGPITIYCAPNGLAHPRLGISIGRKAGSAVRRNRIKRKLREAFRLVQHDLPAGYDFVVTVRPHEALMLAEYQKIMTPLMLKLIRSWQTRRDAPGGNA
jgi:ribonuclease P protein component